MYILIEFQKQPLVFKDPEEVIVCYDPSRLPDAFARLEEMHAAGYYLAGFVSYEAGYAMERALFDGERRDFPLMMMGCYRRPLSQKDIGKSRNNTFAVRDPRSNVNFDEYARDIGRIHSHIAAGDVYQITYCIKLKFGFEGCGYSLYRKLLREQPVPYPAYIDTGDFQILSLSPEMFLHKRAQRIATKPMKGTWPRGSNAFTDLFSGWRLHTDPKNRAENVMIADLLRNDLGRVGTCIRAPKLFEVARYTTLYQMTSTVTGVIPRKLTFWDLFKAVFPSGSVTGAPKIRAMEVIRGIEREERKIYTGSIGYIAPSRDLFFNIPIRTLLLEKDRAEMGIGGGIVWDSTAQGEWEEGILKGRFLTDLAQRPKRKSFI